MSQQVVGSRGKYQYITEYDSYNYNGAASVDAIVVHHWGNDGQKFNNVIAALSGAREASAHYVLEAGKVACIIAPGLRAWHVAYNTYQRVMQGITDVNSHTIGIECRPECTDGDVETLCQLIAELWADYGKVPVYGHLDFMATACPGRYYSKLNAIAARAEEIYSEINSGTTEGSDSGMAQLTNEEALFVKTLFKNQSASGSSWAAEDLKKAVSEGITTGENPQGILTREQGAIMSLRVKTGLESKISELENKIAELAEKPEA